MQVVNRKLAKALLADHRVGKKEEGGATDCS